MKSLILLTGVSAVVVLATTGCRPVAEATSSATQTVVTGHSGGAYEPKNTTKYDLENKSKFVDMDYRVARSVTCSGLQERILEDGRLEVAANVRNRLSRRIEVQIQSVFKDAQGFSTGDETPWQTLILTENSQETVRFTSMNDKAKGYTIRVREAH
ncbi:MAG TPA: YcfL family protein [Candidatus Limnocylindria bacterium]|jgi:hypothetical protein|nr:YcfL family protein [Candidatus Limnocylindria bacterium]